MNPTTRVGKLQSWLESIDLGQYANTFLAHDIDISVLADLTDADMRELGVTLGHRKRLAREIQKLLEQTVADTAEASDPQRPIATPAAERRRVTIIFSDLVGSTNLSVRFDPEDLSNVILAYQNCCEQVIRRWGGHVLNYLGDGVVICFGYPIAQEDSAERAVRAALEIVQEVGTLRPIDDLRMQTRIGIATGEVVIGDLEGDESVAGETPNLAARLQNLAEPDNIVISSSTRRLIEGIFDLESIGKHELKGFAEKLEVWKIKGDLERANRFEARRQERQLSLIGRDAEIATLKALWKDAKKGKGRVALISGEPGMGKSHLCEALRQSIKDEPHTRLRCFCAPYHQNNVLFPIISQMERATGIKAGDDNAARLAKLEAGLKSASGGPSQATALIASLLSITPDERYPPLSMTSQRQRIETLNALLDEIKALAADTPLFMVLEDAHWSDPTTLEIFGKLVEDSIRDLPILLLITYRVDFQPSFGAGSWIHEIKLDRIKADDSHKIVADIAQVEGIPEKLVADIISKSDGVPLFIEELTKAVMEMESAQQEGVRSGDRQALAVPDTLHDSLMSRLDRLEAAKPIAQLGAVIGRRFIYGVLSAVADMEETALRQALDDLVKSELLQCHGEAPMASYTFKHALIQEAAYSSLLRSRVRKLHGEIAGILEKHFPDMAHAEPEVLANHFKKAGQPDEAAERLMEAGLQATSRAGQTEAINHFSAALDILSDQPQTPEREQQEIKLHALLGSALIAVKGYAARDVEDSFRRAHDLSMRQDESPMLCPSMYGLWVVNLARSDRRATTDWAKQLMARFGSSDDLIQRIGAVFANGITSFYRGDLTASAGYLDQVLALYWTAQHDELIQSYSDDLALFAMAQLEWLETLSGDVAAARARENKALDLAERLDDPMSMTRSLVFSMMHHHDLRNVEGAEQMAERALDVAGKNVFPFWSALAQCGHGWAMAAKGNFAAGIETIEQGLSFFGLIDQKLPLTYWNSYLIEALIKAGENDRAMDLVDETIKLADRNVDSFYKPALLRCKGVLQQTVEQDNDAAEKSFKKARSIAYKQRASLLEHRATVSLAKLLVETDRTDEAKAVLKKTRERSAISAATPDYKDGDALLAKIG